MPGWHSIFLSPQRVVVGFWVHRRVHSCCAAAACQTLREFGWASDPGIQRALAGAASLGTLCGMVVVEIRSRNYRLSLVALLNCKN